MDRKKYFESPEGQRHLLNERRRRRLIFVWNLEPRGHRKIKKNEKEAFINHLVEVMTKQGRKFYRSDLALSIDIEVSSQNPPSIEKIPKGYIDLLHRRYHANNSSFLSRSDGVRLLMKDDTQIKFLSVNFCISDNNSSLRLKVAKLDHVVRDLALLKCLDPYHLNEIPNYYQVFDSEFDPDKYSTFLGDKAVTALEYMNESQRQEYLLEAINFNFGMFEILMSGYEKHDERLRHFKEEIYKIQRDQILKLLGGVSLGSPPLAEGESDNFKEQIKQALNVQMEKCKLQKPILHPVRCTIIVIHPDEIKYAGKRKDIDNFAFHFILPIVHQELAPCTTLGKIFNDTYPFAHEFDGFSPQNGLPKSVLQYTIIEIPRLAGDHEAGSVFVFLGKATSQDCYWNELDQKIDRVLENDDSF